MLAENDKLVLFQHSHRVCHSAVSLALYLDYVWDRRSRFTLTNSDARADSFFALCWLRNIRKTNKFFVMSSLVPDLFKSVMNTVRGIGRLSPNLPFELDELLLHSSDNDSLWSIHIGHAIKPV